MKYKPTKEPQFIGVRDLSRNFSYYLDTLNDQPLMIEKHGEVKGVLISPEQFFQKKISKKKKKVSIADLPFFKDFKEPAEWKGKTAGEIAEELRRKAWAGE